MSERAQRKNAKTTEEMFARTHLMSGECLAGSRPKRNAIRVVTKAHLLQNGDPGSGPHLQKLPCIGWREPSVQKISGKRTALIHRHLETL